MRIAWAPGTRLLYQRPGNRNFLFLDAATGETQPLLADESGGWVFTPQYSPDGSLVAVYRNRPPNQWLWLVTPNPYAEKVVTRAALNPIGWSADGQWVYVIQSFAHAGAVGRVPAAGGEQEVLFTLPGDVRFGSVDRSGARIVASVSATRSDAFVVENFDPRRR